MHEQTFAVLQTLEAVGNVSSRKEKERLLQEAFAASHGPALRQALVYANDPYQMFGVIALESAALPEVPVPSWEHFVFSLERLRSKQCTGNDARDLVARLTTSENATWNKWAVRIINKDLRIGAAAKTINKVAGNELIREFTLALCDAFDPNEEDCQNTYSIFGNDFFIEPKRDGWRCVAHCNDNNVVFYSRSGKPLANTKFIEQELVALNLKDVVLDGELMARTYKETTNLCGADVRDVPEDLVRELKFYVFDVVPAAYFFSQGKEAACATLEHRRIELVTLSLGFKEFVKLWECEVFDSKSLKQYEAHLSQKFEGSILKDKSRPYGFSRTRTGWHKVKPMRECDVTAIGFAEGEPGTKNAGTLGAVICRGEVKLTALDVASSTGHNNATDEVVQVEVSVGTGFSDELRAEIWANQATYLGRVFEVGFQDCTKAEGSAVWSLRFPRLLRTRVDKVSV